MHELPEDEKRLTEQRIRKRAREKFADDPNMSTVWSWGERPEHFHYLRSMLMDYLGNQKQAQDSLRLSVELTPVDDDSYLTKVQDYAFTLLDAGKPQDALSFLLNVYRKAAPPWLDELREMTMCIHQHQTS